MTTRRQRRTRRAALVVALSSVAVACSDDGGEAAVTTIATTVAPTTTTVPDDDILRIGTLLPLTGPGAELGGSMLAAVELAVAQVNEAGGVAGSPVELVSADEGESSVTAAGGLEELTVADVDAVIGPASSLVALELLVTTRRERLLTCSPSATSLALDDFPDDGLFVRTVPSDVLQAEAIARVVDQTGRSSVSILYVDDAYGRPLTNALGARLDARAIEVEELVEFRADDPDYSDEVATAVDSGAQVLVVIGDAATGARVVSAAIVATEGQSFPIVVNDALRGTTAGNLLAAFDATEIDRVSGVAVRATTDDEELLELLDEERPGTSGLFATNAIECVDLIALAALMSGSTGSTDIATRIPSVAASGQSCVTFAECREAMEDGRNIDYDGPSSILEISPEGEVVRAVYEVFGFDASGRDRVLGSITVGLTDDAAVV